MSFVQRLDCPVVVMMRGAVVCEGSYQEIQRDPAVRAAYLGQAARVLTIRDLVAGYQASSEVLRALSLDIAEGEIVALMGRNGMGKSTLLKAIMGHIPIRAGTHPLPGARARRAAAVRDQQSRHRLCAAGPRDLPGVHGRGESDPGRARQASSCDRGAASGSTPGSRSSPSGVGSGPGPCPAANSSSWRSRAP